LNAAGHTLNADQAAFFPTLTLNAQTGFESRQIPTLLSLPKTFWSIGPQLAQYLFDGGQRTATRDQQLAVIDQQTATYRQVVLTAFQQVEDSLSTLFHLKEEEQRHRAAEAAAQESLNLVVAQYKAGTVAYLDVISAQTALYTAQSSVLADVSRQATAHVQLITALGGGWKE
jgi:outer membrane protein TolC